MQPQNGASSSTIASDPIDTLESNFKSVVEYLTGQATPPDDKAPEVKTGDAASPTFGAKATKAIKDHPIVAIGMAFGLGYLLTRLVRR